VTAFWRGKVIDRGMLGPGFLSHVIVERFGNHLPYFRLEGQYRSEGLELSRSVLCESMARCPELLEPIAVQNRKEILASAIVNTDDTPVTLAQSSSGGSRQARVWVYLDQSNRPVTPTLPVPPACGHTPAHAVSSGSRAHEAMAGPSGAIRVELVGAVAA
jgi:hypothetical protein